jgi:hypothetical protein
MCILGFLYLRGPLPPALRGSIPLALKGPPPPPLVGILVPFMGSPSLSPIRDGHCMVF